MNAVRGTLYIREEDFLMSEENKAINRRFIEEVFNQGNLSIVDELFTPNYVDHTAPPGRLPGVDGLKQELTIYREAFPDTHVTIEDMIVEGDKVVFRWSGRGTHTGELLGIPPTGKDMKVTGIVIHRMVGGKIAEHWESFDQLGMLQQLGVVPTPGEAEV